MSVVTIEQLRREIQQGNASPARVFELCEQAQTQLRGSAGTLPQDLLASKSEAFSQMDPRDKARVNGTFG